MEGERARCDGRQDKTGSSGRPAVARHAEEGRGRVGDSNGESDSTSATGCRTTRRNAGGNEAARRKTIKVVVDDAWAWGRI